MQKLRETIKNDLNLYDLSENFVFEITQWHCLIHQAEFTLWEKALVMVLVDC